MQPSGKMLFVEKFEEVADKEGFVYAPFHRKTNFPVVFFEPEVIINQEDYDTIFKDLDEDAEPLYPDFEVTEPIPTNKDDYLEQAENLIGSLDQEFQKVVLSRVMLLKKPLHFSAATFFNNMLQAYPKAFCHLINIPGAGCWAGASPEMLFRMNELSAFSVALAGTQAHRPGEDHAWGHKEINEQELVTGHITAALQNCGIVDYSMGTPQTTRAGQVVHLSTLFEVPATSFSKGFTQFLAELHPTPAVCGLPKEESLNHILQTEKHNREYYSGFCGPVNHRGYTDLFVNLRCMKILPEKLAVFTGGGLTAGSTPELEWEETQLKAKTLLSKI